MEEYIDSDRKIATAIGEKDIRTTMIKNRLEADHTRRPQNNDFFGLLPVITQPRSYYFHPPIPVDIICKSTFKKQTQQTTILNINIRAVNTMIADTHTVQII